MRLVPAMHRQAAYE